MKANVKLMTLLVLLPLGASLMADRIPLIEGYAELDLQEADPVSFLFQHTNGDITIVGQDSNQIRIEAQDLDDEGIPSFLDWNESRMEVILKLGGDSGSSGVKLWLPRHTNIKVQSIENNVTVTGISGNLELRLVDGSVMLAENSGAILVEAVDGDIELSQEATDTLEPIALMTQDGNLRLTVSTGFKGTVVASTIDGDITCDSHDSSRTRSVQKSGVHWIHGSMNRQTIPLNGGGRPVLLNTVDGDVKIQIR